MYRINNKGYDEDGRGRGITENRWLVQIGMNLPQIPIPSEPEVQKA